MNYKANNKTLETISKSHIFKIVRFTPRNLIALFLIGLPMPIVIFCFYNPYAASFTLYLFCIICGLVLLAAQPKCELLVNPGGEKRK